MGKTNDLGVTTKERAWAEGNRGKKRVKKKAGPDGLSTTTPLSPCP
jgi:hypothetical protein